jgi:hypothetical protein
MAALPVATRTQILRGLMRYWSAQHESVGGGIVKNNLYNPVADTGMIAELDTWIDSHGGATGNTTGINGAISEPCKSGLTTAQKGFAFALVALVRTGNMDSARAVVGEVD